MRLLTASILGMALVVPLACNDTEQLESSSRQTLHTPAATPVRPMATDEATAPAPTTSPHAPSTIQPAAPTHYDEPLEVGGDVLPPEVVARVWPDYSTLPRPMRVSGVPIVEAVISRRGEVTQVRMIKATNPHLDAAIMEALKQWKFRPATRNGHPVAVRFIMTVNIHWR
jgi:TonB family protein